MVVKVMGNYKSFKFLERMEGVKSVKEDASRGYNFTVPLYSGFK